MYNVCYLETMFHMRYISLLEEIRDEKSECSAELIRLSFRAFVRSLAG